MKNNLTKIYDVDNYDLSTELGLETDIEQVEIFIEYEIDSDGEITYELTVLSVIISDETVIPANEEHESIIFGVISTDSLNRLIYDWIYENEKKIALYNNRELAEFLSEKPYWFTKKN